MECRIDYTYFDNIGEQSLFQNILEPLRILIPTGIRLLEICRNSACDESPGTAMTMRVMPEYRQARMTVYDRFFAQPVEDQRRLVIHEILHIHHQPVNGQANTMMRFVEKHNEDLAQEYRMEYTERMEGFIQDFSYLIDSIIDGKASGSSAPMNIMEMAASIMRAKSATGDGKPYTGVSAIAPKEHP